MSDINYKTSDGNIKNYEILGSLKIVLEDSLSFIKLGHKKGYFTGRIVDAKRQKPLSEVVVLQFDKSAFIPISMTNKSGDFEFEFNLKHSKSFAFSLVGCDTLFVNLDKLIFK